MSPRIDKQKLMKRLRASLDVAASLAMLGVGVVVLTTYFSAKAAQNPDTGLPPGPVSLEGSFVEGASQAESVMVVFTDFQCPYCARFALQTLPSIRSKYVEPGLLRLGIRHLPLEVIHPDARRAAAGSICAAAQGQFWSMHDRFFADPKKLTSSHVEEHASEVGAETSLFRACMAAPETEQLISNDLALAKSLDVRSTPTILIGTAVGSGQVRVTQIIVGAVSFAALERSLDEITAK